MKKTLRGMTLAAMLLSASTTASADQNEIEYAGDGFVTPVAFVGDVPDSREDAYFAATKQEAVRATRQAAAKRTAPVRNTSPVRQTASIQHAAPAASLRPLHVAPPAVQQCGCASGGSCTMAGCASMGGGYAAPSCGCDSGGCAAPSCGCDSGGCASGGCGLGLGSGLNLGGCGGCDSIGCGTMFGGGCDSAGGCDSIGCGASKFGKLGKGKGLASALGLCGKSGWARHEALLWFVQDRNSPALVTTSATGTLPTLPTATTVFGGDLNGGLSAGYRGDVGVFLSDNFGVGGRFWWISENEDSFGISGPGTGQSIGRPFFNTVAGIEDALLVNLENNFSGSVQASSQLDLFAAEAYGRANLGSTKSSQLDLIGGYSYISIEDELQISSTSLNANTARTRTFNDIFDTENEFHGGQIGFEAVVANGRWFARSLTKVHIGNVSQSLSIQGSSTDVTPPLPGTAANSGLLALGNQGTFERDVFTFVPEMNFKLGYRFRDHVEMSVGYTFMLFDNILLAGDQVDRAIDPTPLNTNGPFGTRPAFDVDETSLWVQGIDLGIAITF